MQPLVISSKSWHYRLTHELFEFDSENDICSYTRALLLAILLTAFFSCLVLFLASVTLAFPVYLILYLMGIIHTIPPMVAGSGIAVYGLATTFGIAWLITKFRNRDRSHVVKTPSAIKTMYKHWKDKTCIKIEVK